MSAILAPVATHTDSVLSPVAGARAALDAAQRDLAALDQRIRAYQEELDQREIDRERYTVSVRAAVAHNQPVPKPPKVKPSDAPIALPILSGQRVALVERVTECEGLLRRGCVEEIERRKREAVSLFAEVTAKQIAAWRELLALQGLLDQAGVRSEPLPGSLYSEFSIPAFGRLRPICENHWAHFLASHALAPSGELQRMMHASRVAIESDIGEKLPW